MKRTTDTWDKTWSWKMQELRDFGERKLFKKLHPYHMFFHRVRNS
jgi:hypothetical protein